MKIRLITGFIALLAAGCATATPDTYKDQFVQKDSTYVNDSIGFALTFDNSWTVYPHTATMPPGIKEAAVSFEENGAELLFFADGSDKSPFFARAIVEDTDMPVQEYFQLVKEINGDELNHVSNEVKYTPEGEVMEWTYTVNDDQITFKEYQMKKGKYNIRIGFWTFSTFYEDYSGEFSRIASTYQRGMAKNSP